MRSPCLFILLLFFLPACALTSFFPFDSAKLAARFSAAEQLGGKGTMRRPVKTVHKAAAVDDKKLQAALKKLAVNAVPNIDTVHIVKTDGSVVQFTNPKGAIFFFSRWLLPPRALTPAPPPPPGSAFEPRRHGVRGVGPRGEQAQGGH